MGRTLPAVGKLQPSVAMKMTVYKLKLPFRREKFCSLFEEIDGNTAYLTEMLSTLKEITVHS
jgi:hypothetical protein